jgi:hypothetical protein
MLKIRPLVFISALAVLSACAINQEKDEDSPFYSVPAGSLLVLNQDLVIAAGQVATYVQNGELMTYEQVDKYQPNCKFEVYAISEQPRTVKADTFEIIKVVDDIESSSIHHGSRLASLDEGYRGINIASGMLDHSLVFNYATFMYLSSATQKDVYRITCQHWEAVREDRYLSISQMRQAMGNVFTLNIKQ